MKVSTILVQIDLGSLALPKFQRGYVWNRDQVRGLMHSLYRKHPIGGLLVWEVRSEGVTVRGDGRVAPGVIKLLLDGQQRMTTLYGIIRGREPRFFEGRAGIFEGLHFNLDEETFEFYAQQKMKDNPLWVDVTKLMQDGPGEFIRGLLANPSYSAGLNRYIGRLSAVCQITDIELHVETVSGEDKTIDVVVDLFNRVNSGGTKLSKGDLALAKICGFWPEARDEMLDLLGRWRKVGFSFELEWLLRVINTISTGEALFSALKNVDTREFQQGLKQAEYAVDALLNLIAGRLGLDNDNVLGSRYSFPLLARYLVLRGGHIDDKREQDKLLYWYVHTFLWGRYSSMTESHLNQDLHQLDPLDGALDRLILALRQNRGDLRIQPGDFDSWSVSSRFYPMLYMMTRVWRAKDWRTGWELSNFLLGPMSNLELHHIFPKALLYKAGYSRAEANAVANFTFLTKETNLWVSDRQPTEYLAELVAKNADAVKSTWIPMDRALWKVERYRDFLAARRELLAKAANDFLDNLVAGTAPEAKSGTSVLDRLVSFIPGSITSDAEDRLLRDVNDWVQAQGLPEGRLSLEIEDPDSGLALATLDLAWPDGLQSGLSQPVALLVDEEKETIEAANRVGYRCFTSHEELRRYVEREILASALSLA